jgi:homoaconitate hydratase
MGRPLNLIEKILSRHLLSEQEIVPGNVVCVRVDWTLSSEISWKGLYQAYQKLGAPGVFRGDRIWLAADHIVDPRINHMETPAALIKLAEKGSKELNIKDYMPPNTTILHTEFYRERAQPGMIVIGADSHTCSSGALGALAVGLGVSDVAFPMVTGETFFQVPQTLKIELIGQPSFGITGKDIIMHILGEFKRNTIAAQRVVEYQGSGLKYLSCDARFAIANMSTEFGALGGVVQPDTQTAAFIAKRQSPLHRQEAIYFKPDDDAEYVDTRVIDLGLVVPTIALYPSPDNVVTVSEKVGMELDGVFIGACTTTEEELILAALILREGLSKGLIPVSKGNRRVTPGSLPIIAELKKMNLLQYYEQAGFTVGAPGCSYCVGMGADRAGEGEVWLSSQNRNFKNRMGKGSIGNLASAATVAASSFSMTVTDPQPFIDAIDSEELNRLRSYWKEPGASIIYSEPRQRNLGDDAGKNQSRSELYTQETSHLPSTIISRVQKFGDDVDTDAIIPIDKCGAETDYLLGQGAFAYVRPEFAKRVEEGAQIIVAGRGFGSGSSREDAAKALKFVGVKAVIAKSFAYIYNRNQANIALFGIVVDDEEFYQLAQEGATVSVLVSERKVVVDGKKFPFKLDDVELKLQVSGGIMNRWKKHGTDLFRKLQREMDSQKESKKECGTSDPVLAW